MPRIAHSIDFQYTTAMACEGIFGTAVTVQSCCERFLGCALVALRAYGPARMALHSWMGSLSFSFQVPNRLISAALVRVPFAERVPPQIFRMMTSACRQEAERTSSLIDPSAASPYSAIKAGRLVISPIETRTDHIRLSIAWIVRSGTRASMCRLAIQAAKLQPIRRFPCARAEKSAWARTRFLHAPHQRSSGA